MGFFDRFKKANKGQDKQEERKESPKLKVAKDKKEPVAEKVSTLKPKAEMKAPEAPPQEGEVKAKKAKKENSDLAFKILIKPLITEKATTLVSLNKYAFKVVKNANKIEIKKAIKALYGVDPIAVNIINERGKRVTSGRIRGKKSNWKKAVITLKKGDKIEVYEGV